MVAVMGVLRRVLLRASRSPWLARQMRNRRFVRRAVTRFLPGEDAESALKAAQIFATQGILSVLTELGENVADRADAEAVTRDYLKVLDRITEQRIPAQLSVKLTHLGLDLGRDICAAQLSTLVKRADALGNFVWIDMESSEYTDVTLDLFREMRRQVPNVGVCLQAYLHRTPRDLEQLMPLKPSIRLVKGAYNEPKEIAVSSKRKVSERYLDLARELLDNLSSQYHPPGFGTHDMRLVNWIRAYARGRSIAADCYEVQMLYGIRSEDQRRLAADGCRVRVLISYGTAWFAWYMRRLAERPANIWTVARSMMAP
ncbi:MAG: proline dehydrogenase [Gemmatimonadales bacterium]|nr:Proline dehydrogenase [bacterium HR33]GIW51188.1 MAG: proline dehydrogenase [Gemmatimonadales bacterium]